MKYFLTYLAFCFSVFAFGQAGALDVTFGDGGKTQTRLYNQYSYGNAIAIELQGKYIIAGFVGFGGSLPVGVVSRYNTNGSIDSTFALHGYDTIKIGDAGRFNCIAYQPFGKIVIGGRAWVNGDYKCAAAQLLGNGVPDTSFGINGRVIIDLSEPQQTVQSLVIQPDGKVVLGCTLFGNQFGLIRLNNNGVLDTSFGTGGYLKSNFMPGYGKILTAITMQPDGKIVCAGYLLNDQTVDIVVARYNTDGTPDTDFNQTGFVITDINQGDETIKSIGLQNGKILVGGYRKVNSNSDVLIVRYNTDGTIDNTFGENGFTSFDVGDDIINGMVVQPDGKIIVGGYTATVNSNSLYDYLVVRFTKDGLIDDTFGSGGYIITDFNNRDDIGQGQALQADGKIVMVGYSVNNTGMENLSMCRYLNDLNTGILEFSQTETAPLLYPNPVQQVETLKYTLAENETISISLIDATGKLVQTFIEKENQTKGAYEQVLNFPTNLAKGSYYLVISSPKGKTSIKLMN